MGITFTLTANVDAVTDEIEARINRALNRIGIRWHAAARQACPVDTGRLRSSIAFTTPTLAQPVQVAAGNGQPAETFTPPSAERGTVIVGSNVEYAPAIHEGVNTEPTTETVKAHVRRAHTRRVIRPDGRVRIVNVAAHQVAEHERHVPARKTTGRKFIEGPARQLAGEFQAMLTQELTRGGNDARSTPN